MEIKTRYYVCNCCFDIRTFIISKSQGKSKQVLKFHTAIFEDENLSFQLCDAFGVLCLICVYIILRDKDYGKKEYARNILNISDDKTFGPRLFKNFLHEIAHMFDDNDDEKFYSQIGFLFSGMCIVFMYGF